MPKSKTRKPKPRRQRPPSPASVAAKKFASARSPAEALAALMQYEAAKRLGPWPTHEGDDELMRCINNVADTAFEPARRALSETSEPEDFIAVPGFILIVGGLDIGYQDDIVAILPAYSTEIDLEDYGKSYLADLLETHSKWAIRDGAVVNAAVWVHGVQDPNDACVALALHRNGAMLGLVDVNGRQQAVHPGTIAWLCDRRADEQAIDFTVVAEHLAVLRRALPDSLAVGSKLLKADDILSNLVQCAATPYADAMFRAFSEGYWDRIGHLEDLKEADNALEKLRAAHRDDLALMQRRHKESEERVRELFAAASARANTLYAELRSMKAASKLASGAETTSGPMNGTPLVARLIEVFGVP